MIVPYIKGIVLFIGLFLPCFFRLPEIKLHVDKLDIISNSDTVVIKDKHFTAQEYKTWVKKIVKKYTKNTAIPEAAVIGMARLETGNGSSDACRKSKNHFGILCINKECNHNKCTLYRGYGYLRAFDSDEDCFDYFIKMVLYSKRYKLEKPPTTTTEWLKHLVSKGYSDSPYYIERVLSCSK